MLNIYHNYSCYVHVHSFKLYNTLGFRENSKQGNPVKGTRPGHGRAGSSREKDMALLPITTHDYQDTTGAMLQVASTTGCSQTIIINIYIAIKWHVPIATRILLSQLYHLHSSTVCHYIHVVVILESLFYYSVLMNSVTDTFTLWMLY